MVKVERQMDYKNLYQKYKDLIPYVAFGVLTTVVNIVTFWIIAHPLGVSVMPSTIIAWITAVLFAYITNRKWVFRSDAHATNEIAKEIVAFFACRLATGVVDWVCMFVLVELLGFNDVIIKFIANIIVISLNYVASKLIIFKHKE